MTNKKKIIDSVAYYTYDKLKSQYRLNYSLLGGDFGEIAFLYYYSLQNHHFAELADECVERMFHDISRQSVLATYCNGLAGLGVGLLSLQADGFLDGVDTALEGIDGIISLKNKIICSMRDLDFLHGAIGLGFYFLSRYDTSPHYSEQELIRIYKLLEAHAIVDSNSMKWAFPEKGLIKRFNISLSHGMSAIIIFLCRLYQLPNKRIRSLRVRIKKMIEFSVKYILANKIDYEIYGCRFVSSSIECEPSIRMSRLAWCYGDLGVLYTLYNAAIVLEDVELQTYALNSLVSTAETRRDLRSNFVNDACVCHGAAGLSIIFKSLNKRFQCEELLSAADYWAKVALNFCHLSDGRYSFLMFNPSAEGCMTERSGLLEGPAGVAMALLQETTPLSRWLLFD